MAITTESVAAGGGAYPLTKMNFIVSIGDSAGVAAFSEVSGIEASVDVIEFRQGNSGSLAPVKIPGLVKHGNITMKYGMTLGNDFTQWVRDCTSEQRGAIPRASVVIELIDISGSAPNALVSDVTSGGTSCWTLSNAWVTKYSGTDLNAMQSEIAIESVEIAYEEMQSIPNAAAGGGAA
jgi:phage tail-like protein